ncbi:MAG: transcriptional regulator FilR1 domain-containing protein [Candidatus Helarchaeota archaeon]
MIPIIQKKIQTTELDIKAIIDRELFNKFRKPEHLPPNANKLIKQIDFFKNIKIAEQLNVSITITDNGAILFLRAGDSIDYSHCIFSRSEQFLNWTTKLFESFWKTAIIIKPSDLPTE